MGWMIIDNNTSDSWFRVLQSVRNYMFIMRSNDNLYDEKLEEALSTYDSEDLIPERKGIIRYTFELTELLKDKVLNRPVYDLNYH